MKKTIIKLTINEKEEFYSDVFALFNHNVKSHWLNSELCEEINNSVYNKNEFKNDYLKIEKLELKYGFPDA